ncbi:hypothetical protein [Aliarcobacter cryaerophilus]|uniref:hypothetical protein n=1 Tax=Aliarcobacter cryaerophilus TaxID=28198 RepID=UPI003DA50092
MFFYHNYKKVSAINKKFKGYLKSLLKQNNLKIHDSIEDNIEGVDFKISILSMPKKGTRKIAGAALPLGASVKQSRDINSVLETISDFHLSGVTTVNGNYCTAGVI